MQQEWTIEDLIDRWTFTDCDWALIANKTGATRLGFGLLLKFFELEARFPLDASEFPSEAVVYAASQLKVDPAALDEYAWTGRTIKGHRSQIRSGFGFREASVGDADKLAAWLAEEVCPVEFTDDRMRAALAVHCRAERLEPPSDNRVARILGSARASFEADFASRIASRLGPYCVRQLEALIFTVDDDGERLLTQLKADPGRVGLETVLREIEKLTAVRARGVPADLFSDTSEKLVDSWRARAARLYPSDLRAAPPKVRLTLLAALC